MHPLKTRRGQGIVEYILIVALMGIVCIAAITALSNQTKSGFTTASSRLSAEFGKM